MLLVDTKVDVKYTTEVSETWKEFPMQSTQKNSGKKR
jgi:hypothetical protein